MSKIVIDARVISGAGVGRYIERLLTQFEKLDSKHEFIVLVPEKDREYWKASRPNFRVEVADFANYSFSEQIGFYSYLKNLNADLVHFCMPQQPLLLGSKKIATVHDLNQLRLTEVDDMNPLVLKIKQFILGSLLKRIAKTNQTIITPTEYTKHDFMKFTDAPEEKIRVTYESADRLAASPSPVAFLDKKQFLLYVGRAEPYKNNRGLIKAHQLLLSKFPSLELVFVGKKDEFRTRDEQWVYEEGYKNITFFGFASNAQLAWLYEHCAAYVFPSFMEGFGLPGLEAMIHGAPVASSDSTCLPEVYGDAALYFDAHNPTNMAAKIEALLNDQKLAAELRKKGLKKAKEYSWQRMAEQTLAIYEDALKS